MSTPATTPATTEGRRVRLVGPLFGYDLGRLARRHRTLLLRCTYALLLLVWLCFLFGERFLLTDAFGRGPALPLREWARFALDFVTAVLALQGAAVFVLTPAYLASAVAEEKERRTLELLFTTPLLDREIVLGKLFSRLAHLASILLTALPIISLTELWGGVDGNVLLAGFAVTVLALLSVGGLSILCSVCSSSVLSAVASSYVFVAFFALFCFAFPSCSPATFLGEFDRRFSIELRDWQDEVSSSIQFAGPAPAFGPALALPPRPDPVAILLKMLGEAALAHGFVFLACTGLAIVMLDEVRAPPIRAEPPVVQPVTPPPPRKQRPPATRAVVLANESWGPFEEAEKPPLKKPVLLADESWGPFAEPEPRREPVPWAPLRPPVSDPALLWKEAYHGSGTMPGPTPLDWPARRWGGLLLLLGITWAYFLYLHALGPEIGSNLVRGLNPVIRVLSIGLAGIWCLVLAFRAAGSVCRERDRRTLESLLLLPVERAEILRAKWLGSILRGRRLGYGLAALWVLGLVTGALHCWAVVLLAAACGVYVALLASLGVWLSLASRNTLWANLTMALILLLLFGAPWLGGSYDRSPFYGPSEPSWWQSFIEVGLHPVSTWWTVGFSWGEFADGLRGDYRTLGLNLAGVLAGLVVYGLAAWVFWRLACARLDREPDRRQG